MKISLEGKVALVTGGSRGIGAATVRVLRASGARVVFSYKSAADRAQALVDACGGEVFCRAIKQDLSSAAQGEMLIAAAIAVFGRLDILIVNHGIWPAHDQPIATMSDTQWHETTGVNLDSVFGLVRAGTRCLLENAANEANAETTESQVFPPRKQIKGHIVLIASTAAQRGEAFHADYAASKGALLSLTKSLSSELGPQGILCNCVAPGWVSTEMAESTLADPVASKKALSLIPMGRAADPDEIAGPIVFLCSPWAGFISGEILNVNGGAVLVG